MNVSLTSHLVLHQKNTRQDSHSSAIKREETSVNDIKDREQMKKAADKDTTDPQQRSSGSERERRRTATEARIFEVENSFIESVKQRRHDKEIESMRTELEDMTVQLSSVVQDRDREQTRSNSLMKELERRKTQVKGATDKITDLNEQIEKVKKDRDEWMEKEKVLQKEITDHTISTEATVMSLQTKVSQKREHISELECRLMHVENEKSGELNKFRLELQKTKDEFAVRTEETSKLHHQFILQETELKNLRDAVGTSTPRKLARTESMEDMLISEVRKLKRQLSELSKDGSNKDAQDLAEQLGSFRIKNENLEKQVTDYINKEATMNEQIVSYKEEVDSLKTEIERLNKVLGDRENESEITHKYLYEENSKIKQQKAELRVRLMESERKYAAIQGNMGKLQTSADNSEALQKELSSIRSELLNREKEKSEAAIEIDNHKEQIANLEKRLLSMEKRNQALQHQLDEKVRDGTDDKKAADVSKTHMESKISALTEEKRLLLQASEELDVQCEQINKLKLKYQERANEAETKCEELAAELLQTRTDYHRAQEALQVEQRELDRVQKKAAYLQEELSATHVDYRSELASLANQVKEAKQTEATDTENLSAQIEHVKTEKRQIESEMNSVKRQLEEAQIEIERYSKETHTVSEKLMSTSGVQEKLQEALKIAIEKGERIKNERDDIEKDSLKLEAECREMKTKIHSLEKDLDNALLVAGRQVEQLSQKNEKVAQLEKLLTYLQSQVTAPTPVKKKTTFLRPSSPGGRSVGMNSAVSYQDLFADERLKNSELAGEVRTLNSKLVEQTSKLRQRQASSSTSSSGTPMATPKSQKKFGSSVSVGSSGSGGPGTMRHDIPHRWKKAIVLRPMKCPVCMDGLPLARQAQKCAECNVTVHRRCADSFMNTCGLPMLYTDYYLDQQKQIQAQHGSRTDLNSQSLHDTPSAEGRMTGWVKVWRSDHYPKLWRDAWAIMDETTLNFYEEENAPDREPFEIVDLTSQQWRIRFQRQADDAHSLASQDVPYLVEIKIAPNDGSEPYRLYLMAPTLPAKQRWVNALQVATSRRMFARRVSSLSLQQNSYLRLENPHNLSIHSTAFVDQYILLGCEEGLFYSTAKRPSVPYRIAGSSAIYQLEVLSDIDTIVVITGQDRQVGFIHLGDLRQSLKSRHPGVKTSLVAEMQLCHLFICAEWNNEKYLCIADPDQVNVMSFNKKLNIFTGVKHLQTKEPATCLNQIGSRILIGAEKFLVYNLQLGDVDDFLDSRDSTLEYMALKAPHRQDYPAGAIVLKSSATKEIFLSYQNYGIFVDWNGRRTREGEVEWLRSPLEFAYIHPYLYVMHFESIELFVVPPHTGPDSPLLEPRSLMELASPHYCGKGINPIDLLVVSSKLNITDLMIFNPLKMESKDEKSLQKRKQYNEIQRQGSDEKRQRSD